MKENKEMPDEKTILQGVKETEVKKVTRKRAPKVEITFNEDDFYFETKFQNSGGVVESKLVLKAEYNNYLTKCKIRAARHFDVTLERIGEAASLLNGRVFDGFQVTDLIGRFGFIDGVPVNRADVATKYGKSVSLVEMACEKLKEILKSKDVIDAYRRYVENESKPLVNKEVNDGVRFGV